MARSCVARRLKAYCSAVRSELFGHQEVFCTERARKAQACRIFFCIAA